MLVVRGTKKLRDRLKQAPGIGPDDASTTSLGDWFATALFWKPQVALLVNTATMIPVFTPLAPAGKLLDRAPEAIAEVLRAHGVPGEVLAAELAEMGDVRLAPTNDRQVLGVMNEFIFQAEHSWGTSSPDLFSMSMRIADVIVGPLMKRHHTPAAELAAHFGINADLSSFPVSQRSARAPKRVPKGQVHQLKVALRDTKPPIWRRVVVEGTQTLDHLHDVIQAAFGWWNYHLHEFTIDGVDYSVPSEDDWKPVKDERRVTIDQALAGARRIHYMYDFGDGWHHDITIEKTSPIDATMTVPDCIDGRRACPPEDCGGTWGYRDLLEALADPAHPEHAQMLEWTGGDFDPDEFDPSEFADNLDLLDFTAFS